MGTATRIGVTAVFVLFVFAIALRPLFSNPVIEPMLQDGSLDTRTIILAAMVLVPAALIVGARLTVMRRDSEGSTYQHPAGTHQGERGERGWDATSSSSGDGAGRGSRPPAVRPAAAERDDDSAKDGETERAELSTSGPVDTSHFLAGQGGARERHFMIEDEQPDAELSDHLDHLQTALDDEESREELETLEAVVAEEGENPIPARCPQDHCDARWTERSILGFGTGRYEILENKRDVVCLECERVTTLDSELILADSDGEGTDSDGEAGDDEMPATEEK